jgi:hypothetical protein
VTKTKNGKFSIKKGPDGSVTVVWNDYFTGFRERVQIRAKTPEEKFNTIRQLILEKGLVFTEKIEKMVRKELGLK